MLNSDNKKAQLLPIGSWVFVGSFSSISISLGLYMILFLKRIVIDQKSLCIKYFFGKEVSYLNSNLVGYMESVGYSKTGEYQTFYFKTEDDKIHIFNSNEFRNYSVISGMIAAKCSPMKINKLHNLKKYLITLSISTLIITILILVKLSSNAS